jgi:hypothetical protein
MLTTKNKTEKPVQPAIKQYIIEIGSNVKVTVDAKSKSRVINTPFEFPDGTKGILVLIKIKDESWVPNKDIKNIQINFQ